MGFSSSSRLAFASASGRQRGQLTIWRRWKHLQSVVVTVVLGGPVTDGVAVVIAVPVAAAVGVEVTGTVTAAVTAILKMLFQSQEDNLPVSACIWYGRNGFSSRTG